MKFSDFGFKENPFAITPDPHYLFLSRGHEESLAHLLYGTGPNGGFVQLTGEVGTGKTLLVRSLLEQKLEDVDIALILNPRLSRRDFLATICDELGVSYVGPPYMIKQLTDNLTRHLLKTHAAGRHTVVVIDEAQNLSPRVLEQVRLLTNLETSRHKLLRIILVGQPELQQLLARKDLRQVNQRITARYHLSPLSREETARYIRHRLAVAGADHDLFTPTAMRLVHLLSRGVPRMINTLCERALLAIFTSGSKRATTRMVWRAYQEIRGKYGWKRPEQWILGGFLVCLSAIAVWWTMNQLDRQTAKPEAIAGTAGEGIQLAPLERVGPVETAPLGGPGGDEPAAGGPDQAPADKGVSSEQRTDSMRDRTSSAQLDDEQIRQQLEAKLYALWGKSFEPESPQEFCRQALPQGLRCLSGTASWADIGRLDRPMLLRISQAGATGLALAEKLRDDQLLIDEGRGGYWVDKSQLAKRWRGDFILLWRPPKGGALIGPGSSGAGVTWLRERLSLADGEPASRVVGVDHFEDGLKLRLKRFQKSREVAVDGIAGAWTMILLNNLLLPDDTPTLAGGD
jgi:general secretion pathway protein A